MARKFIYCIVDPRDNSYDYEKNGYWTDDLGTVQLWQLLGVPSVVALDALSMELVCSYDNDELAKMLEDIPDNEKNLW